MSDSTDLIEEEGREGDNDDPDGYNKDIDENNDMR